MLHDGWRSIVRTTSFMGKELREVWRRPGVLASLVLGPFLIMLLFGLGYTGARAPFRTEIVLPANTSLPQDPGFYEDLAPGQIDVTDVTEDEANAERHLRNQQIDLMVVVPQDAVEQLRAGEQTEFLVAWNEVDPVNDGLAHLAVSSMTAEINAEIIRRAASEGIDIAEGQLGPRVTNISPDVIAKPTRAVTQNVSPSDPILTSTSSARPCWRSCCSTWR